MSHPTLFVLGGARSGKSRYAQLRAEQAGLRPLFIATAQAFDDEMADRIARHRSERGSMWRTVEAPYELADAIARHATPDTIVLVDCLTLWASNVMLAEGDLASSTDALAQAVASARGPIILVANEVGLGIVPDTPLGRRFRDAAGTINQRIAATASEVQLLVAGLPIVIKPAAR